MTDNVKEFGKEKVTPFPVESELCERIFDLIAEYDNELSLVAVVGILEMVKRGMMEG